MSRLPVRLGTALLLVCLMASASSVQAARFPLIRPLAPQAVAAPAMEAVALSSAEPSEPERSVPEANAPAAGSDSAGPPATNDAPAPPPISDAAPSAPSAPAPPPVSDPAQPAPSAPTSPAPAAPTEQAPVASPAIPAGSGQPLPPPAPPLFGLPTEGREVALTIDDGPSALTADFLAVLAAEQVPATFFWLTGGGRFPLAADLVAQGHQLGTHTISHPALPKLEADQVQHQLAASKAALEAAAQAAVRFFRPPYGAYDETTLRTAEALGLTTVLWNVDSRDWALVDRPDEIIANVMKQVKPGAIILIHERKQTLAVLPGLIRSLKEAGYSFRALPVPVTGKG